MPSQVCLNTLVLSRDASLLHAGCYRCVNGMLVAGEAGSGTLFTVTVFGHGRVVFGMRDRLNPIGGFLRVMPTNCKRQETPASLNPGRELTYPH